MQRNCHACGTLFGRNETVNETRDMKTCSVCSSKRRKAIDEAMLAGMPLRDISTRYGPSRSALNRHKPHIAATVAQAHEAAEVCRADSLLDQVKAQQARGEGLLSAAERLLENALAAGDSKGANEAIRAAVATLRELRGSLELKGKILGAVEEKTKVEVSLAAVRDIDLRKVSDADLELLAAGDDAARERILESQREKTPAEARAIMRGLFGSVGPLDDGPPRVFLPTDDLEVATEAKRRGIAVPPLF